MFFSLICDTVIAIYVCVTVFSGKYLVISILARLAVLYKKNPLAVIAVIQSFQSWSRVISSCVRPLLCRAWSHTAGKRW